VDVEDERAPRVAADPGSLVNEQEYSINLVSEKYLQPITSSVRQGLVGLEIKGHVEPGCGCN
jgi:hypothetical protein